MQDSAKRRAMTEKIGNMARVRHIVCLQEVHGELHEILALFQSILPNWIVFHSGTVGEDGCSSPGSGGVVTLVSPAFVANGFAPSILEMVPGRVQKLTLANNITNKTIKIYNIHNYMLPRNLADEIFTSLQQDCETDARTPGDFVTFALGDFNYLRPWERPCKLSEDVPLEPRTPSAGTLWRSWEAALEDYIEFHQPHPTHFVPGSLTASKLDRVYGTLAKSLAPKLNVSSAVVSSPDTCFYNGFSDHCPVEITISKKGPEENRTRSIPKAWCETKMFAKTVEKMAAQFLSEDLLPFERLDLFKTILWEAAKKSRDFLSFTDGLGTESSRLVFESMSRAIWHNDYHLATKLINNTSFAHIYIKVEGTRVVIIDAVQFEAAYADEKRLHFDREVKDLQSQKRAAESTNLRKQLKARIQAKRRMQKLWWPKASKLMLFGLRLDEMAEDFVSEPGAVQNLLTNHWQAVYEKKPVDEDKMQKLLGVFKRRNAHVLDFSSVCVPSEESIKSVIKNAKHSQPGRDGIPYAAFKAVPDIAAMVLAPVAKAISENPPPDGFNDQNVVFAPKGKEARDNSVPSRAVGNLRTISLLNTDNKVIATAQNRNMIEPVLNATPPNQRGFCPGRQFLLNVVTLDTWLRVFNAVSNFSSSIFSPGDCPVTTLYDICNAFPTIAHVWLFACLKCLDLPSEVFTLIQNLYVRSAAFSCGIGTNSFMFYMLAGVRTGCPLSATLFLLALNPFVDLLNWLSDGPGPSTTCICADDVGSVLRRLKHIKVQYSIFKLAQEVAGMVLKPSKCFLVVSCIELTPEIVAAIRSWLKDNIPQWQDFQIVDTGKYLGIWLGRNSPTKTYEAPVEKFKQRVLQVFEGKSPSLPAVLQFNERVSPVFSYVSQVMLPPSSVDLESLEQHGIHKILHLPPNCMSRTLMHSISDFCAQVPRVSSASCAANMTRFAKSSFDFLHELHARARDYVGKETRLVDLASGRIPRGGCQGPAMVDALLDAAKLAGKFNKYRNLAVNNTGYEWMLDQGLGSDPGGWVSAQGGWVSALSRSPAQGSKSIQSQCYSLFSLLHLEKDIARAFARKLTTTVGEELASQFVLPVDWYAKSTDVLKGCKEHVKMCVLKTYIGGWTTSHRMHESTRMHCIFGCRGEADDLQHYLNCAPLWLLAAEALGASSPLDLRERLGIINPSVERFQMLALCYQGYHYAKANCEGDGTNLRIVQNANYLQSIVQQALRTFKHNFG